MKELQHHRSVDSKSTGSDYKRELFHKNIRRLRQELWMELRKGSPETNFCACAKAFESPVKQPYRLSKVMLRSPVPAIGLEGSGLNVSLLGTVDALKVLRSVPYRPGYIKSLSVPYRPATYRWF